VAVRGLDMDVLCTSGRDKACPTLSSQDDVRIDGSVVDLMIDHHLEKIYIDGCIIVRALL
jgi:hypothetical protein